MARMLVDVLFLTSLCCSSAIQKSISEHIVAEGVEIREGGQVLMRQASPKHRQAKQANLVETGMKNPRRAPAEAAEAFESPSKIDDSFFGTITPRMAPFIEQNPWFYFASFVGIALAFLSAICFYVKYEDSKDDERREIIRIANRRAAAHIAFGVPRPAFAPPRSLPPPALYRSAVEAAVAAHVAGGRPMRKGPGFIEGMLAHVDNITDNMKMPKFGNPFASPAATTASGASTPRSQLSSQAFSAANSGSSRSKDAVIRSGTVLMARVPEVIFASTTSWQEIGELHAGQQVIAAGPPEAADDYSMVPIKPRGAVDLKTLEVVD